MAYNDLLTSDKRLSRFDKVYRLIEDSPKYGVSRNTLTYNKKMEYPWSTPGGGSDPIPSFFNQNHMVILTGFCHKNAILDGCSTVDSMLDYDGIGWYSMVLQAITWYLMVFNNAPVKVTSQQLLPANTHCQI